METDVIAKLKAMETKNTRLRKLLVDRDLEIEVMKEINRKSRKCAGQIGAGTLGNRTG